MTAPARNDNVVLVYDFRTAGSTFAYDVGTKRVGLRFSQTQQLSEWGFVRMVPILRRIDHASDWDTLWDRSKNLFADHVVYPYINNAGNYATLQTDKNGNARGFVDLNEDETVAHMKTMYKDAYVDAENPSFSRPAMAIPEYPELKEPLTAGIYVLLFWFSNYNADGTPTGDAMYSSNVITFPVVGLTFSTSVNRNLIKFEKFSMERPAFVNINAITVNVYDMDGTTIDYMIISNDAPAVQPFGTYSPLGAVGKSRILFEQRDKTPLAVKESFSGSFHISLPAKESFKVVITKNITINVNDAVYKAIMAPMGSLLSGVEGANLNGSLFPNMAPAFFTPSSLFPLPTPLVKAFWKQTVVSLPADHNIPLSLRPIRVYRARVPSTARDYALDDPAVKLELVKTFGVGEPLRAVFDKAPQRAGPVKYVYATLDDGTTPVFGPSSTVVTPF